MDIRVVAPLLLLAALAAPTTLPTTLPTAAAADPPPVCALACDRLDPSQARQETFPVPDQHPGGRLLRLHVSDPDAMAWASVDGGQVGDQVWLDRSWDGGASWDGLLGMASIPSTWTGTRTLMYNLGDPSHHRRGLLRACANAGAVACTSWAHADVCETYCDRLASSAAGGDLQPVPATTLSGRTIALHHDSAGMAWATLAGGRAGDEVWLDRSWDAGASWPDGSSLGRVGVPAGAAGVRTVLYNTRDPRGLLYGGAVRACGRAVEGQNGSCTAWARPAPAPAAAAADALMWSYDPYPAWWPSSWWNSAVALTTLMDYEQRSGDQAYRWVVDRTFTVNRVPFPAGARSSDPIQGDFRSRAIDDGEWWGLAWIEAYDLTGDQRYLDEAAVIGDYTAGYWDTATCGGGVWWNAERTYKNAVTTGLYVRLAAALHRRLPGDTVWLDQARTAWNWFAGSGLINAQGLVNDGLDGSCHNNGQQVWTYNQGLAIGGAVELWRATGDPDLLTAARHLADSALASPLVVDGVLTESCDTPAATCDDNAKQFKGVFVRYLADLAGATGDPRYQSFLTTQASTVWTNDRDPLDRLGERWSGSPGDGSHPNVQDWRTQASALATLVAALP